MSARSKTYFRPHDPYANREIFVGMRYRRDSDLCTNMAIMMIAP